jgi:hypothetical protein
MTPNVSHERIADSGATLALQEACRGSAIRSMARFAICSSGLINRTSLLAWRSTLFFSKAGLREVVTPSRKILSLLIIRRLSGLDLWFAGMFTTSCFTRRWLRAEHLLTLSRNGHLLTASMALEHAPHAVFWRQHASATLRAGE